MTQDEYDEKYADSLEEFVIHNPKRYNENVEELESEIDFLVKDKIEKEE